MQVITDATDKNEFL